MTQHTYLPDAPYSVRISERTGIARPDHYDESELYSDLVHKRPVPVYSKPDHCLTSWLHTIRRFSGKDVDDKDYVGQIRDPETVRLLSSELPVYQVKGRSETSAT